MYLTRADLAPFDTIEESLAEAMIADAEAQALLAAPCLIDATKLPAEQTAGTKAVLRRAVLRWHEVGTGGVTQESADMADACAGFYDATQEDDAIRHLGQVQLTESLNSARKRSIGDRWAWNRKSPEANITPIVAATLAHWGVLSPRVRDRRTTASRRKAVVL